MASAKTLQDAWTRLANMYFKLSCSKIMRVKERIDAAQASNSILDYMQHAKTAANELGLIVESMDEDDLIIVMVNIHDGEFKDIYV